MNNSDQKPKVSTHENSHFKVFEDAYQATDAPTFGLNDAGIIIFWNDAMLNITDYYPEETVGRHYSEFAEIFYYEDTFSLEGLLQNLTGKLRDRKGVELQVRTAGVPVTANGIQHVYLSVQNITKETVHVQELVKNNILMKELFSSSREMVVVFNRKGNISFASEPFKNLVNMTDPQIRRTTFINLIPNSHRTRLLIGLKMAEESQDEHKMELTIESESQKRITDCHISYKADSKDCYRLHLFDITDKKRKELEQEVSITFAKLLQENLKIQELYEKVYLAMKLVVDMDSFLLLRLKLSGQGMYIPFYSTKTSDLAEKEEVPASEFALAMANVLNRPMFMYKEVIQKLAKQYNLNLINVPEIWMGLPLISNNQKMGMIVVQSFSDRKAFSKPDLNLFDLATGILAAAIIRDQSQLKVRAQRAQLEAIFESGEQAIWTFNKTGMVTRYNQHFAEYIKQYSNIELMPGMMLNSIIPFTPRFEEHWDQILKRVFDGESISFEYKFQTFLGTEQWHSISLNPVRMQSGDGEIIQEIAGVTQNITQRKKMEIHIADSEELFRNIFETLQDVYFRTDLDGNFTLISPSVKDMLGVKPGEIIDKHVTEYYISESDLSRLMKMLAVKGAVKNHESIVRNKKGEVRYILSNFRLIYDKKLKPSGVEGLARDITPIKQSEHELREAKDLAEKSLEVKRQFLSNMSHEIRTPMNGVIGMVDLLSTTVLSQEQKKYVSTIKRSSEILLNILNDILDLSKIEAGKMELRPLPIDIRVTISKLIALFHQNAKNKSTQLISNVADNVPNVILADETRLLQILSNLTSNAIKFTEDGTVTINVNGVQKFNGIYTLMFDVIDTGCGISKNGQAQLFKQFSQVEDSYKRTKGGTGLGLSISQELCNMMDGDIGVESELNVGSTFWFTIEVKEVNHLPPTNNNLESKELFSQKISSLQPNILVVDDNSVNIMVAESILKKAGCKTTSANSGFKALELLEAGNEYDIIFMDIQMPKMNGMETTQRIHETFNDFKTPIIAMTAFTLVEEQQEFLKAGMDDFLPKPIKAFDLLNKVEEIMNDTFSSKGNMETSATVEVDHDTTSSPPDAEEIVEDIQDDTPRTDQVLDEHGHIIVDYAVTAELAKYGGNELIQLSFEDFFNEGDDLIHELVEAKSNNSIQDVKSIMHTFKGTAATLGIIKLSEKAKHSEQKLKHDDTTNMDEDIDDVFSLYNEIKTTILNNLGE
ncbi:PAS domain-containing hybrid sensor histidine kinase/response regulator [Flammeovirga sp. EKP202]|uniref:PAS domain-containing hybrid sensor histidine kinase/response regulator n=1 Tax=Flammeovirga sp. EKP202 TaxID=2770592 RepID=UPI00165F40F6|nr:PAS domain-containing hybrid sensor histidine kinase/response regulator [Flammeovirga sp. EKP202]MBD0402357.1 PAS domain S-box protein [Flammeovirga sp. EKP202]